MFKLSLVSSALVNVSSCVHSVPSKERLVILLPPDADVSWVRI